MRKSSQIWPVGAHEVPFSRVLLTRLHPSWSTSLRVAQLNTLRAHFELSLPQSWNQLFLRRNLGPFSREWCMEARVWALGVSKATGDRGAPGCEAGLLAVLSPAPCAAPRAGRAWGVRRPCWGSTGLWRRDGFWHGAGWAGGLGKQELFFPCKMELPPPPPDSHPRFSFFLFAYVYFFLFIILGITGVLESGSIVMHLSFKNWSIMYMQKRAQLFGEFRFPLKI